MSIPRYPEWLRAQEDERLREALDVDPDDRDPRFMGAGTEEHNHMGERGE